MEVSFSDSFKKSYKKRIKDAITQQLFWEKLEKFTINPFDNSLKTHKLSGKLRGLQSFSVDYNVRVVFYFTATKPTKAIFVDIGSHDEVY